VVQSRLEDLSVIARALTRTKRVAIDVLADPDIFGAVKVALARD